MKSDSEAPPAFAHVAILLMPLFAWTIASYFLSPTDPDVWWHLKMGEVILDTWSIPNVDLFSFLSHGKPMLAHEWLSEVIFAAVQRSVGYGGLCALFGVLAVGTLSLVYQICRCRGLDALASVLTSVVVMRLVSISAGVRPQMFSVVGMSIVVLFVTRVGRGAPARWEWGLPVIFGVWANLHGGFVIGLITLWMTYGVGCFNLERGVSRRIGILSLLCTLATLATPHGINAWLYPFQYADLGSASLQYIAEWQSPSFHDGTTVAMLLILLCMCVTGVARRPSSLTDVAWTILFTSMALVSSRHIPLFGVVVTPIVCARLLSEYPKIREWLSQFDSRGVGVSLCFAIPLVVFASHKLGDNVLGRLQSGDEPSDVGFPRGAVNEMRNGIPPGTLLNEYDWGGYLLYKLYPTWRIGVDGRADVHGDATMSINYRIFNASPGWQSLVDSLNVEYILTRKTGILSGALRADPSWQLMFEGDVELLFARLPRT